MCGIAAIWLTPQERPLPVWNAILEIFTRNLVFNEERGRAATGLAIATLDGQVEVLKMPLPASVFVATSDYQSLLASVNARTVLLLGHTRLPTKGDPSQRENNHPVQVGPLVGVHNGQILNDDALFARFACPRQAEVDSEIIFRLLEPLHLGDLPAVQSRLSLLQGQFACLAWDQRSPQQLLVVKHNNPLCVHFHPGWNALIFSSRYIFLRKAFGRTLIVEALEHDRLLLFDATRLPSQGIQPLQSVPLFEGFCDAC